MGKREFDIMDSTGHTKHIWDSENESEVKAARELFASLTAKGFSAFRVTKEGAEGQRMNTFDPDAEKMILVPRIVAG